MHKAKKLYILLGVLAVICLAAFAVSRHEEKKEQIKTSGEVILEIPADSVTALSWENESGSFSFTKSESWTYDSDDAFPVDEEKINDLLSPFASFSAAFIIEKADDLSQYGLDKPVCTINLTAADQNYTISLGSFSKMDEQRYVSIGDENVYLVSHDPMEEFDAVLSDVVLDDTLPEFDTAQQITFSGAENYTITRNEEKKSICSDDVYFSDDRPLDTDNVDSYIGALQALDLSDYVTYNASDEELSTYGLHNPELTVSVDYTAEEKKDSAADSGSFTLNLARNPRELEAYNKAKDEEKKDSDLPAVTCYARVGESKIIYRVTQNQYDKLIAASYDTLRHQKLFTADFDTVTSIDVTLDGETSAFTCTPAKNKDDEDVWKYKDTEFDIQSLRTALQAVSAAEFTDEAASGQTEISLTLHLDNEDFPEFTLTLYRYDGTNCIAAVDSSSVALVSRSQTVNLIEAVHGIILNS